MNSAQRGVITSANWFFRSIGGSLGVTIVGAVFNARLSGALASLPGGMTLDPNVLLEPASRSSVSSELLPGLVAALQHALQGAYLACALMALAVIAAAAFLPGGPAAEHAWKAPASAERQPT